MSLVASLAVPTVVDALVERARRAPDAVAFRFGHDELSFGDLLDRARRTATALRRRGLGRGDRCALVLPTGLEFVAAVVASELAGAIPVAVNPGAPPDTIAGRLRITQSTLAIAPESQVPAIADATRTAGVVTRVISDHSLQAEAASATPLDHEPPSPDDPAYFQLTSGTTGDPKAAVILHRNLMAYLQGHHQRTGVDERDVLVNWLPLHYSLGLVRAVFGTVYFGWRCHLVPPGLASLGTWLEAMARERATITASADFGYRIAAERAEFAGLDLRSLRMAISGGEGIRLTSIEAFERRFGLPGIIMPGYGLSEATLAVTSTAPGDERRIDAAGRVASGRPVPGVTVALVDESGMPLAPGRAGEITVRGPTVFAGYFDDEAATREILRDGRLYTGDEGVLDRDGYLYVLGRTRTLIKRAGTTIIPRDAEEVTERLPGVRKAAAVGLADEEGGAERFVVVAELDTELAASGVERARMRSAIGRAVADALGVGPSEVLAVSPETIPRTENGKIRYGELRRLVAGGGLAARET